MFVARLLFSLCVSLLFVYSWDDNLQDSNNPLQFVQRAGRGATPIACPHAASRESHRTRNKNKQTNIAGLGVASETYTTCTNLNLNLNLNTITPNAEPSEPTRSSQSAFSQIPGRPLF
jgi:hypothetical protein